MICQNCSATLPTIPELAEVVVDLVVIAQEGPEKFSVLVQKEPIPGLEQCLPRFAATTNLVDTAVAMARHCLGLVFLRNQFKQGLAYRESPEVVVIPYGILVHPELCRIPPDYFWADLRDNKLTPDQRETIQCLVDLL